MERWKIKTERLKAEIHATSQYGNDEGTSHEGHTLET